MDRDKKFTEGFRRLLDDAGTRAVCLPPRSPNLNAYVERLILSIMSECLDHLIFFGENSLRRALLPGSARETSPALLPSSGIERLLRSAVDCRARE